MSGTLQSPGVLVTITDESVYNTAGQGTTPLFIIATRSNKKTSTGVIAPYTVPNTAGKLFYATSQRDLITNFGNPYFKTFEGTPVHGDELNEYGLWSAYSYLGIATHAYILRADVDLGALEASTSAPKGLPVPATYWLDLGNTRWGVFRANGSTSPGAAWELLSVRVPMEKDVKDNVPLPSYGSVRDIAVVALTHSNYFYEKLTVTTIVTGAIEGTTMIVSSGTVRDFDSRSDIDWNRYHQWHGYHPNGEWFWWYRHLYREYTTAC